MASAPDDTNSNHLSRKQELLLAAVGGIMVANAYYIHPIIAKVASDFGVDEATIGLVPAFNQIALAIGILVLLPLGDRISNRKLMFASAAGQTSALLLMAFGTSFTVFLTGSTILGFFTIGPYLLPAYASKRANSARLGQVTATLTVGSILGILVARIGAGLTAQYLDWHLIYWVAGLLMVAVCLALPLIMEGRHGRVSGDERQSYPALVFSTLPLMMQHREVLLSGTIQALNFGIFLVVWLALGFHLTSPEMGYGYDTVGYLAGLAIVSMIATPRLAKWADRVGAVRARFFVTLVQFIGVFLMWPLASNLWLLMIPIILVNAVGPTIDVCGRMTTLSLAPEIRTRLMTGYIVLMFSGAGLASWAGTAAYGVAGWNGAAALAVCMSVMVIALSAFAMRMRSKAGTSPQAN